MPHRLLAVPLAALVLAGCAGQDTPPPAEEGPPPQVVFETDAASATARPAQHCDLQLTACTTDPAAPVTLAVPPGSAVTVSVPPQIAQTPWQVVFSYRDASGGQVDERSPVWPPNGDELPVSPDRAGRFWVLQLPQPTDQLLTAEVQQYGPPPVPDPETGELQFPIRASWVLNATG